MQFGRKILYTDAKEVTKENIADILRNVMDDHEENARDIQKLLDFEAGQQPIKRKEPKKYRPDIDCQCVDNVASE